MTPEQADVLETLPTSELASYLSNRWRDRGGSGVLFFSVPLNSEGDSECLRHVFGDPILSRGCAECALDMARSACFLAILAGKQPKD